MINNIVNTDGSLNYSYLSNMDNRQADLGSASAFGVTSAIGATDATTILNNYFAALKAKGLKYAYFDQPFTYNVSGALTNARDLILIGNASIKSTNPMNYYIQICKTFNFYNEKYNTIPQGAFIPFSKAILENRNIKVAIWGDSISTGGSDCLNMSYSSLTSGLGATESPPNGLTGSDSYFRRLMDLMVNQFKSKTFDFYNRAIGGAQIQQWNTNQTFNGVTKPWIDHLRDTQCDLLILALGMNNGTFASAKEFKYYLKLVMDYIGANFNPIPMVAVVTTPRPSLSIDDTWGSFETQAAIDMAAYSARTYGHERGCYIVDVNKISNIKRCGVSYENPIMKTIAATEAEIDAIATGNFSKVGSEYILQSISQSLKLPVQAKDFVLEFDVKFDSFPVGDENFRMSFNSQNGNDNVILSFVNSAVGHAAIRSYMNFIDSAHFPTNTNGWDDIVSYNDSVYRAVRVEKRGEFIDFFINGVKKIRDRVQINNIPGDLVLMKNDGAVGKITVKNIKVYNGTYEQYVPTLTEYEMWGLHENGVYGTKPLIGGNGVNHPATSGVGQTYAIAIKEFVEDLAQAALNPDKGVYVPTNIPSLGTPAPATTTSGAQLRYFNTIFTSIPDETRLQYSDGTYWTRRTDINDFASSSSLLDGQFAAFTAAGGITQVVLAKTDFTTVTFPLKFWSWLNP